VVCDPIKNLQKASQNCGDRLKLASVKNCGPSRFSVLTLVCWYHIRNFRSHYLKKWNITKIWCGNRKTRNRIVEYETVYFHKAVKYDESQRKHIRDLPKTQLSWYHYITCYTQHRTQNDILAYLELFPFAILQFSQLPQ
jgi:hypothetical protein